MHQNEDQQSGSEDQQSGSTADKPEALKQILHLKTYPVLGFLLMLGFNMREDNRAVVPAYLISEGTEFPIRNGVQVYDSENNSWYLAFSFEGDLVNNDGLSEERYNADYHVVLISDTGYQFVTAKRGQTKANILTTQRVDLVLFAIEREAKKHFEYDGSQRFDEYHLAALRGQIILHEGTVHGVPVPVI